MNKFEKWILKSLIDDIGILTKNRLTQEWMENMKEKYAISQGKKYVSKEERRVKKEGQILPRDLLVKIASYLDPGSLARISGVCKYWYCWSRTDICWNGYVSKLVKMHPDIREIFNSPSKDRYVNMHPIKDFSSDDVNRKAFRVGFGEAEYWKRFIDKILPFLKVDFDISELRYKISLLKIFMGIKLGIPSQDFKLIKKGNYKEPHTFECEIKGKFLSYECGPPQKAEINFNANNGNITIENKEDWYVLEMKVTEIDKENFKNFFLSS